jgi:3-hydroxyacyl-[acyl-carrier-protein] dehydratase
MSDPGETAPPRERRPLEFVEVRRVLPQQFPFIFIDRVVDHEPGQWARCHKCVTALEPHFSGHLPTNPVMPGVLIVEAMAQALCLALLTGMPEAERPQNVFLGAIREARFLQPVRPGDRLEIDAQIERMVGKLGFGKAVVKVEERTVAKAQFSFGST